MLRNVASNWGNVVLALLTTALLLPINLHYVGNTAYGAWLVVIALSAYLLLLQLGLPLALVRNYSVAHARDDVGLMRRIAASNLATGFLTGMVALALLPLLDIYLQRTLAHDPVLLADTRLALKLLAFTSALTILWQTPHAIVSAYQAFVPLNAAKAAILCLKLVVNLVAIRYYPSIVTLAIIQVIGAALEFLAFSFLALRLIPFRWFSRSDFSLGEIRNALGLGIYSFLLVAGTQLIFQTSTVIVGAKLGPAQAAFYSIPTGLILQFLGILLGIAQVVMPVATQLNEKGQRQEVVDLLHRWTKIAVALTFLCAAGLILVGPDLVRLWLGSSMSPAAAVLQLSILAMLVFLPARGAAVPILMGLNKMARMTQAIFAAGIANAVICYAIVGYVGVKGAAYANIATCWTLGLTIMLLVCRELEIKVVDFISDTCLKPAIALAVILAAGFAVKSALPPVGVVGLLVGSLAITVAFAGLWYGFVLRNDRHVSLPSFGAITQSLRGGAAG